MRLKREKSIGMKFGNLTVIRLSTKPRFVHVLCDCGNESEKFLTMIKNGNTKSCGCLYRKHKGMRQEHLTTYESWKSMRDRCYSPKCRAYPRYGGKGIEVCDQWKDNFLQFLKDMGVRPEGKTLDRKNGDGDYNPLNCRWATNVEQNTNRSVTIFVSVGGIEMSLSEASRRLGFPYYKCYRQVRSGKCSYQEFVDELSTRKADSDVA